MAYVWYECVSVWYIYVLCVVCMCGVCICMYVVYLVVVCGMCGVYVWCGVCMCVVCGVCCGVYGWYVYVCLYVYGVCWVYVCVVQGHVSGLVTWSLDTGGAVTPAICGAAAELLNMDSWERAHCSALAAQNGVELAPVWWGQTWTFQPVMSSCLSVRWSARRCPWGVISQPREA